MPTAVLKLFAGQCTGRTVNRTDGQSGDYMLPPLETITSTYSYVYIPVIVDTFN